MGKKYITNVTALQKNAFEIECTKVEQVGQGTQVVRIQRSECWLIVEGESEYFQVKTAYV